MNLRQKEIWRYLGYQNGIEPETEILEKINTQGKLLQDAIHPGHVLKRFPIQWKKSDNIIFIAGYSVSSVSLARNLEGCSEVYLLAATIGLAPDRLIRRASITSMTDALILQAISTEMIEAYCRQLVVDLNELLLPEGKITRPRFSPGYGDLSLEFQKPLLLLLDAFKLIGLSLTSSLLLMPTKSVTAIIGIQTIEKPKENGEQSDNKENACSLCTLRNCAYRKDEAETKP